MAEPNAERRLQLQLSSSEILRNAASAYSQYERWMDLLVQREPGYYRVTGFGSHHLEPEHPHMAMAGWFGYSLGQNNIDLIEGSGGGDSVMGRLALGHSAGCKDHGTGALNIGNSIRLPWEDPGSVGVARHKVVSHSALPPRLDYFGGLAADFIALEGGVGTFNEIGDVWQRVQFAIKINTELIPQGLRLCSYSASLGWRPKVFCYGDDEIWGWLKTAIRTFATRGRINTERREHEVIEIYDDHEAMMAKILERREEWRAFMREHAIEPKN